MKQSLQSLPPVRSFAVCLSTAVFKIHNASSIRRSPSVDGLLLAFLLSVCAEVFCDTDVEGVGFEFSSFILHLK
ncbi:hypothetical protein PGB90_007538 [Kerria lacca]